ncbi:MAG: hypothetical protein WCO63_04420 [Bacteroidota bacterium]
MLLSLGAFAQQSTVAPTFFKLTSFTGQLSLDGYFRQEAIKRGDQTDTADSYNVNAGVLLNATSFFYHPDFFQFDVYAEYSPGQSRDRYIAIPDEGEMRTTKRLDLRGLLFQKKIVSLSAFANASQTFSNREFLSDIKTDSKNFGGVFFLRTKYLPLSISYQKGNIIQNEINTGRLFSYDNDNLEGRVMQSFGRHDRHELILSRNYLKRIEKDMPAITNDLREFYLTDEVYFDRLQRQRFNSLINFADQVGYDTMQRKQAFETLSFKLPWKFELGANYNYYDIKRERQNINQQTWRGLIRHKLFESLNSNAFYENVNIKQTDFDQKEIKTGINFMYEKKIPTGQINLSYSYLWDHQEQPNGASQWFQVMHEQYILIDATIVLLKRPNVDVASLQVRDVTGTILYQVNFDYIIVTHGQYLEIQRVPGGQIANNMTVFVDYRALMPGAYRFDMHNENWSAGITLFKRLVNLYYRHQKQSYRNLQKTDFITLDSITQNLYGFRTEYKSLSGGVEYDDYNSSIMPYKQLRYFISWQGEYRKKLIYSLNANLSEYELVADTIHQQYSDVNGQLGYNLNGYSKITLELGYRHQSGEKVNIDLDMLNARLEYTTQIRQIFISVGAQTYRRNYMNEINNYNGLFFKIARRF